MKNFENPILTVGIDIGTTTISAVVYDVASGEELKSLAIPHNSYTECGVFSEQSVSAILEKAENALFEILDEYAEISSIGITGQMHGILYVDGDGNAVSNLITWQDKRADASLPSGKSATEEIFELTGEKISTGYGIATHYYNLKMGLVPKEAVCFCSIMDAFAMKICAQKELVTHASVGASFGLFDGEKCEFMYGKIALLGIEKGFLPRVTSESLVIGTCRGIPVSVPIGDNQASFLGSVGFNCDTVLVNLGTGAQISAISDFCRVSEILELRPLIENKYLICGSALCGGYAYSMLEGFFRSYAGALGIEGEQYQLMNALAKDAYERGGTNLIVDTSFLGKRNAPDLRGSVKMIGKDNFTPADLTLGVLQGMCSELFELYAYFPKKGTKIVASGGAVKKNEVLRRLIERTFETNLTVSTLSEEASCGAALFSSIAAKKTEV